jgi:hypothetical protein
MVERVRRRYGIVHWYIMNITITMQSETFFYFAHDSGCRQSHHLHLHAAGKADPCEAMPYPLVIQDHDLRTLLEIKLPEPTLPPRQQQTAKHAQPITSSIAVPTTRVLPQDEQPDIVLRDKDSSDVPVVQRSVGNTPPGQAAEPMSVGLPVDEEMKKDPPYLR